LALKLKDKLPEATAEFRKAEELDPRQADVHYTLGVTLWQQGDFPAAAEELRAAIRAKPDYAEACYTLGTVLKQQGKLEEAASSLREAIRLQPDFAGAHTTLAAVLRQLGDAQGRPPSPKQASRSANRRRTSRRHCLPRIRDGGFSAQGTLTVPSPSSDRQSARRRPTRRRTSNWDSRYSEKERRKKPQRNSKGQGTRSALDCTA